MAQVKVVTIEGKRYIPIKLKIVYKASCSGCAAKDSIHLCDKLKDCYPEVDGRYESYIYKELKWPE